MAAILKEQVGDLGGGDEKKRLESGMFDRYDKDGFK